MNKSCKKSIKKIIIRSLLSTFLILTIITVNLLAINNYNIKIGASSVDITPNPQKIHITTGGYFKLFGHVAKGIHDPIYAKAIVFEALGKKATLVAVDLVEISRELRNAVIKKLSGTDFNSNNIFICATHTHSAPGAIEKNFIVTLLFGPYNPKVVEILADGIAKAIKNANAHLFPSRLSIAQTQSPGLTRNRNVSYYNYNTRRFSKPFNPKTEPVADSTITVIRLDHDLNYQNTLKNPIAIIVHFATHATILGHDNVLLSSDWPGVLRNRIEAKYPDSIVMYINGAEGDQAPDEANIHDDYEAMNIFSSRVADSAIPLIARTLPIQSIPFKFDIQWTNINVPIKIFKIPLPGFLTGRFKKIPFSALRLGDLIFLGSPMEIASEIGLTIKKTAKEQGYKYPVYIGLMNLYFGYTVTPEMYNKGGYEAGSTLFGRKEAGFIINELTLIGEKMR